MLLRYRFNILLVLFAFTLGSCGFFEKVFSKKPKTPVEELKSFSPIKGTQEYVTMQLSDFKNTHDTTAYRILNTGKATYYVDDNPGSPLKSIYYMFNHENNELYEIIYEYESGIDVEAIMKKKYGEPNNKDQWRVNTMSGTTLKIWRYGQKICIADASMFPFG